MPEKYPCWLYKSYDDAVLVKTPEDDKAKRAEGYRDTYARAVKEQKS